MTADDIVFRLAFVALAWVTAYFAARSPRRFFDQFRESPMFQQKSRRGALISATLWAAFVALFFFLIAKN